MPRGSEQTDIMLCPGWLRGPRAPQTGTGQSVGRFGVGLGGMAVTPWSSLGPGWPASRPAVTLPSPRHPPQDIITALEERLKPLVQAELSVLVDVLHWPELLFLEGSEAHQRCESGGFLSK